MQEDKVLYSEKVSAGKRTYFLDVKENHQGTQILKITESRKNGGEFIRSNIMIFQEDFDKLFDAIKSIKQYIEENPSSQPNKVFPAKDYNASFDSQEEDINF